MNKHGILVFLILLAVNTWSESVNVLVWSKTKEFSEYKSSIAQVVADALNKTEGLRLLSLFGLPEAKGSKRVASRKHGSSG